MIEIFPSSKSQNGNINNQTTIQLNSFELNYYQLKTEFNEFIISK